MHRPIQLQAENPQERTRPWM